MRSTRSRCDCARSIEINSSKLNDWLTLIANLAVVGGIVFLAVEIQQNNELLRSESRQALISNDLTSLTENVAYADLFVKLASDEELSAKEQMQLSFIFTIDLRNREFEYFQYVNGLLDEETWLSYRQVILINHSSERGRAWWDKVGRRIVDPEFGRLVDALLENAEPDDTYKRMSTWADG